MARVRRPGARSRRAAPGGPLDPPSQDQVRTHQEGRSALTAQDHVQALDPHLRHEIPPEARTPRRGARSPIPAAAGRSRLGPACSEPGRRPGEPGPSRALGGAPGSAVRLRVALDGGEVPTDVRLRARRSGPLVHDHVGARGDRAPEAGTEDDPPSRQQAGTKEATVERGLGQFPRDAELRRELEDRRSFPEGSGDAVGLPSQEMDRGPTRAPRERALLPVVRSRREDVARSIQNALGLGERIGREVTWTARTRKASTKCATHSAREGSPRFDTTQDWVFSPFPPSVTDRRGSRFAKPSSAYERPS